MELNALESIISTGVTTVNETNLAFPDFKINVNIPATTMNSIYRIRNTSTSQLIQPESSKIDDLECSIYN